MKKNIAGILMTAAAMMLGASLCAGQESVTPGAARTDMYIPILKGRKVALMTNHTGMVGDRHTLDIMLENGVNVVTVFAPEHGFRGTADAGELVSSSVDERTGIPITSLYGERSDEAFDSLMKGLDVIVTDIQDVGLRFYTYYITMLDLMNAAIEHGKDFMVLDRPNPNGMYVDGPVLDMKYKSGVGGLPIPVVHGLTLGEMAGMAQNEGWLSGGRRIGHLYVIPCLGYTHQTRYRLPRAPSPNLPDMKSVYLYPSMCFFEATPVSLGRGTDKPFQIFGHPDMQGYFFEFTPRSVPGAGNPPQLDRLCHGVDLSGLDDEAIIARGINLEYLINAYRNLGMGDGFFSSFFELLIGRGDIRTMIEAGWSAERIEATWRQDVEDFRTLRRKYLLYSE